MKVVHWRHQVTGETGYGLPLDDAEADTWATIQNKKYPVVEYWTEPVDEDQGSKTNEVDENNKADIKAMLAFVEVGPTSSGSTKIEDIVAGVEDLIPETMFDEFNEADDEKRMCIFWDIHEYLNGIAPEGVSFGASEGDGACFGFWKDEED